jgi:hypothetical protein
MPVKEVYFFISHATKTSLQYQRHFTSEIKFISPTLPLFHFPCSVWVLQKDKAGTLKSPPQHLFKSIVKKESWGWYPSTINHGWWCLYWLLTLQWVTWVIRRSSVTPIPIFLEEGINHFSLMNFSYLQSLLPNFPQRMQGNHLFFQFKKK